MICDYCLNNLFLTETWGRRKRKSHHDSAETWIQSMAERCHICVSLADRIYDVLKQQLPDSYDVRRCLLELLPCPVWRASYDQKATRGQYLLVFEALPMVSSVEGHGQIDMSTMLPQSFVLYSIDGELSRGLLKPLETRTSSPTTFDQVSDWMQRCNESHGRCTRRREAALGLAADSKNALPRRLISVGHCNEDVKLVETDPISGKIQYMTLSHCWGQEQPLRLLSTNTHRLLQRIEWDELPLTFQHAMTVVRHLGIGYLWIDSLCIQQDSVEDWQSEGARMSIIYTSSYCNIAAVDSTSCQGGLFHDRSPRDLEPYLVSTKWTGSLQRYGMIRENYWSQKLLSKALYGRAWVFQERLLSPRIIHFCRDEVLWQCEEICAGENCSRGLPRAVTSGLLSRDIGLRNAIQYFMNGSNSNLKNNSSFDVHWKTAVATYSACRLTRPTDKLMAISGIAKIYSRSGMDKYCAGLWHVAFVEQLAWQVRRCRAADGGMSRKYRPPGLYVAPSWSWASVDGIIDVIERVAHQRDYLLDCEMPNVMLKDTSFEFGEVIGGQLRLKSSKYRVQFQLTDAANQLWTASELDDGAWFFLYPDEAFPSTLIAVDASTNTQHIAIDLVMLAYTKSASQTYSGSMLALRAGILQGCYIRVGMVEFRTVTQRDWALLDSMCIERTASVDLD